MTEKERSWSLLATVMSRRGIDFITLETNKLIIYRHVIIGEMATWNLEEKSSQKHDVKWIFGAIICTRPAAAKWEQNSINKSSSIIEVPQVLRVRIPNHLQEMYGLWEIFMNIVILLSLVMNLTILKKQQKKSLEKSHGCWNGNNWKE